MRCSPKASDNIADTLQGWPPVIWQDIVPMQALMKPHKTSIAAYMTACGQSCDVS